MKTYIVQYRIDGDRWMQVGNHFKAYSPAGAIAQAIQGMSDIEGNLQVAATLA